MGTLHIRKRSQAQWAIACISLLPFAFALLNELFSLPHSIRYTVDFACLFLLLLLCVFQTKLNVHLLRPLLWWVGAFFLTSAVLYIFHFESLLSYLWAVRNNFRFYPFFFAAALFSTEQDVDGYLRLFDFLFWVNAIVSLWQYIVLGLTQDRLGGIFGTEPGCLAYINIFFVLIIGKTLIFYLNWRESTWCSLLKCLTALCLSAVMELKFFFAEFILLVMISVCLTRKSKRTLILLFGAIIAVMTGGLLLIAFFPEMAGVMSLEGFWKSAVSQRGYTSSGDLNRLTAIPLINEWFLHDPLQRLFGLGLGNCETSSFAILNTDFYQRYHDLHYSWLSTAFLYLEMGWTGLLFVLGFFLLYERCTAKLQRRGTQTLYCQLGRVLSLCAPWILIYNSSMRTEAAFMLYLFLAFPYHKKTSEKQ